MGWLLAKNGRQKIQTKEQDLWANPVLSKQLSNEVNYFIN